MVNPNSQFSILTVLDLYFCLLSFVIIFGFCELARNLASMQFAIRTFSISKFEKPKNWLVIRDTRLVARLYVRCDSVLLIINDFMQKMYLKKAFCFYMGGIFQKS